SNSNTEVKETMKVAITAKKAVMLLMTMALAVAFVACQGAAGLPGEAGEAGQPGAPGEPGETPKLVPLVKDSFPSVLTPPLVEEGEAATVDLSTHFHDLEGQALTYTIAVDPAEGVVTAELADTTLTIAPVAEGEATITVTATDTDDLSVSATIMVTVAPEGMMPPVRTEVEAPVVSVDVNQTHTIEDISRFFSESEEETLTYSAPVVDPPLTATATLDIDEADSTLDLIIRGDAYGEATVTVTVTDEDGLTASLEISVTVEKPAPVVPEPDPVAPEKTENIQDQMLYKDDGPQTITLADHFRHDRDITYTVESSVPGVVEATEAAGILTLTPIAKGNSRVTVTAMADELSIGEDFDVEVMSGSKPPPEETDPDPIEAMGEIADQTVEIGKTKTVDVASKFSITDGVDYMVTSSATDKATATNAGSMVTITGVAAGSATVTVTATDSHGNPPAMQPIDVTVIAARPDHINDIDTLSIEGVGAKPREVRADADQELEILPDDQIYVSADPKSGSDDVWVITGKKKTPDNEPAMVRVRNANQRIHKTISVTVGNTPPEIKEGHPNVVIAASDGLTTVHARIVKGKKVNADANDIAAIKAGADNRLYHVFRFNFSDYFKDDDGLGDIDDDTGYFAMSNEPFVKVMDVGKNYVVADVRKDVGAKFTMRIYVVDKSKAMSKEVVVTAASPDPISDYYEVRQIPSFGTLPVHMRQGATHKLAFKAYGKDDAGNLIRTKGTDHDGFSFINEYEADGLGGYFLQEELAAVAPPATPADHDQHQLIRPPYSAAGALALPPANVELNYTWGAPSNVAPVAGEAGSGPVAYLDVTSTGPVKIDSPPLVSGNAATQQGVRLLTDPTDLASTPIADGTPTLTFTITDSGTARVTFTYYRLVGKDGPDDGDTIGHAERKWGSAKETLVMNIR
ncbi:MAG: hypothetical protein OXF79_22360, partial [Chloroflexi bacterium]|nr:hypothetical protein [Chloroflexota bacterium]